MDNDLLLLWTFLKSKLEQEECLKHAFSMSNLPRRRKPSRKTNVKAADNSTAGKKSFAVPGQTTDDETEPDLFHIETSSEDEGGQEDLPIYPRLVGSKVSNSSNSSLNFGSKKKPRYANDGNPGYSRSRSHSHSHGHQMGRVDPSIALDHLAHVDPIAKKRNFLTRAVWTVIMVSSFVGIILAGHLYVILLVLLIQATTFKEVISIAHIPSKEKKLPWFRSLNWYFLLSTNYFLYGESLIHYFAKFIFVDSFLMPLARHHRFISFSMYCLGFVLFVMNLKKGHYKFQFAQFGLTHMTLFLVVFQSQFIANNIFEGMIWFVLPASVVIVNDICAYIFGVLFGRTPLIKLSPKKTWEGFLGALVCSFLFAFFFSRWLSQWNYMICPAPNLHTSFWSECFCKPNPIFLPQIYNVPPFITGFVKHVFRIPNFRTFAISPLQWHSLSIAAFASVIAPFGGFFASGFKRACKIKDFGASIPGHGGMTDRMDCQFLMGLFSYIYIQSFVKKYDISVGQILQLAISRLDILEQQELYYSLSEYLLGQGIVLTKA